MDKNNSLLMIAKRKIQTVELSQKQNLVFQVKNWLSTTLLSGRKPVLQACLQHLSINIGEN